MDKKDELRRRHLSESQSCLSLPGVFPFFRHTYCRACHAKTLTCLPTSSDQCPLQRLQKKIPVPHVLHFMPLLIYSHFINCTPRLSHFTIVNCIIRAESAAPHVRVSAHQFPSSLQCTGDILTVSLSYTVLAMGWRNGSFRR